MPRKKKTETAPVAEVKAEVVTEAVKETAQEASTEKPAKKAPAKKTAKERALHEAMLTIKHKFGKNAVLKGTNFKEGATAKERNRQIGGHKA